MKIELNIPENLNEVKLSTYQNFLKVENPTDIDVISTFLKLSKEEANKIKAIDVIEISQVILKMFEEKQDFKPLFKIGTKEFGFIPDLESITFGENTDIVNYIQDWDTMHNAMAVMYRPVKQRFRDKYIIEDYEGSDKYANEMKQAPLSVVMGAVLFFYLLTIELVENTIASSLKEMETHPQRELLQKNGEIIINSLNSLKATLGDLMKFPSFHSTNATPI